MASSGIDPTTFIEMMEVEGEWCVRVVENGREAVNTFDLEWFANIYAEEKRIRLRLDEIMRV